jgi:hypothetical protein
MSAQHILALRVAYDLHAGSQISNVGGCNKPAALEGELE